MAQLSTFGVITFMRHFGRSILFGALTALLAFGASAGLVSIGGFGPCGPASGISVAGVYLQMPAFFLVEMWFFRLPSPLDLAAIFLIQTIVWSAIWFAILRVRRLRKMKYDTKHAAMRCSEPGLSAVAAIHASHGPDRSA